ncbi:hypothetical protein SDC9_42086 [bioreactor metagenome]|uniref:Uncharacterized protein n=1 Tax=bioreactor metagenome TaxID=1076179 RepID=A0A644W028_9ZZZZ
MCRPVFSFSKKTEVFSSAGRYQYAGSFPQAFPQAGHALRIRCESFLGGARKCGSPRTLCHWPLLRPCRTSVTACRRFQKNWLPAFASTVPPMTLQAWPSRRRCAPRYGDWTGRPRMPRTAYPSFRPRREGYRR